MENVYEICEKYGLKIKEVEPEIYEVLNNDAIVNVDRLKMEFNNSALIIETSDLYEKDSLGFNWNLSKVFYISKYDKRFILDEVYLDKLNNLNVEIIKYKNNSNSDEILTIYSAEEFERLHK